MKFIKYLLLAFLTSCASPSARLQRDLAYTPELFLPITFLENKSHLAMNIHYPPVQKIKESLELSLGEPLKNRGEAHITVITPPEFEKLKTFLSMEKINLIAVQKNIQQMSFTPVCNGVGRLQIDGREESTYFIVVQSEDLLKLRSSLQEAFVAAGGALADFNANLFFPHITLGFTKRDLHYEDGILKDKSNCPSLR